MLINAPDAIFGSSFTVGCIGERRWRRCIDDVSAHAIDSSDVAKASAMICSLVETAKANQINNKK